MFKKIALAACTVALLFGAVPGHAALTGNGGGANGSFQNGGGTNGGGENGTSPRGAKTGALRQDAPVRLNVLGAELPPAR